MPEEPASGVSYATTQRVTCPECAHAFTFEVWLIVDPHTPKEDCS